jgi:hypothetical protein
MEDVTSTIGSVEFVQSTYVYLMVAVALAWLLLLFVIFRSRKNKSKLNDMYDRIRSLEECIMDRK